MKLVIFDKKTGNPLFIRNISKGTNLKLLRVAVRNNLNKGLRFNIVSDDSARLLTKRLVKIKLRKGR